MPIFYQCWKQLYVILHIYSNLSTVTIFLYMNFHLWFSLLVHVSFSLAVQP